MEKSQQLVSLQISLLRICGVWPKWTKPFEDCVGASVGLIIYTALIWILSAPVYFHSIFYWPIKFGGNINMMTIALKTFGEVLVRFAVVHMAISRRKSICSLVAQCDKERQKKRIYLFLLCVFLFLEIISISQAAYPILLSFSNTQAYLRAASITNTDIEIDILVFGLVAVFLFQTTFLPTCLLLTFSSSIANSFRNLENKLKWLVESNDLCLSDPDHLSTVKLRFYELCCMSNETETIFRHYFTTVVLSISVTTVAMINLNNAEGCGDTVTFTLTLTTVFLGLLILCSSGNMITSAVSGTVTCVCVTSVKNTSTCGWTWCVTGQPFCWLATTTINDHHSFEVQAVL